MDISVIVPLYKGKKYVANIIKQISENINILKSNGLNLDIELIFVNDYPEEYIEYQEQSLFTTSLITNIRNEGVHKSRIEGYKASKGNYIVFLDQDDLIDKNYLMSQFNAIGLNDLVICNGLYRNGKKIFDIEPIINSEWLINNFKLIRSPGQVMISKSAIPSYWIQNVIINSGADDMFLWSLIAIEQRKIIYNNQNLFTHVEDGTNTSFNWEKQRKSLEEIKEKMKNYTSIDLYQRWKFYINESILKFSQYEEVEQKWLNLENEYRVYDFLNRNRISSLAIYGYGIIGKRLYNELQKLNINVDYICDKFEIPVNDDVKFVSKIKECEAVDLMIVTPIFAISEIKEAFKDCPIKKLIPINEFLQQLN